MALHSLSLYYGFEEAYSSGSPASFDGERDLDLKGHKIINLAHPSQEGDAINLKYVTKELGSTKRGPKGDTGAT